MLLFDLKEFLFSNEQKHVILDEVHVKPVIYIFREVEACCLLVYITFLTR